ncbi:MAG: AMP-binding protein [Betaproteobacteria bacterium]|nr:AMP-binding protein [Betaproteobacteria bacterium]
MSDERNHDQDGNAERDAGRLLARVAEVVRESHPRGAPRVTLDSSLDRELGLDSLARVELVLRVEREFGARMPEQVLAQADTPRDLLRFVLAHRNLPHPATGSSHEQEIASLAHTTEVGVPDKARTLVEAFEWHVARQPERLLVHLYDEDREYPLTYRALYESALGYAARLSEAGLQPGQTVAIMLPTSREYLYCFYGVLLAGGVPVPLYPPARLTTIEDHMTRHVRILQSAGVSMMVTIPEARTLALLLRAQVASLHTVLMPRDFGDASSAGYRPIAARGSDVAFLQYTSGSTGTPKGVVLTHDNLLANVRAMGRAAGVSSSDVFVSWLPLYHDMGLIGGCFATLYWGFPVVLMSPLAFLARPAQWLWAIHRHRGTISGGPNFAFELCLRRIDARDIEGLDLSSWRFAFNGAEPVSPETLRAFEERFAPQGLRRQVLAPVYGLAECSVGLAFTPPGTPWRLDEIDRDSFSRSGKAIPASAGERAPLRVVGCGQVIPGHDLRVVDAAGLELPERQEGILEFRGPSATSGYYRNSQATRELFDGEWLNTGDRAYLAEGMLFLTGREKDIIIRGGRNISPYELEEAVGDLPGIRRGCVAVFGSPDAATGTERVVVLAETREVAPATHDRLRTDITRLAVTLTGGPADDIVLAPPQTVPKTSSGKIRRVAAREFYERGPTSVKPVPVWWQFVRLAAAGLAPQARRLLQVLGGALFALRAWTVLALLFPAVAIAALTAPVGVAWAVGRVVARVFLRLSGIAVLARGTAHLESAGATVIAANHTSYLDVVVLLSLLRYRHHAFVAKREFLDNFAMRSLLRGFGTLFVERFDVRTSAAHAEELSAAAQHGRSLIVFPEGGFTRDTGLKPFRTGAFQAAALAGIPVIPVALRGVRSVLRDGTWWPRRATIAVTVGAPRRARGSDWSAAVALRDAVREDILQSCGEPDLAAPAAVVAQDTARQA